MFFSDMPAPLKAFLKAAEQRDSKALLSLFTKDAVLTDEGRDHSGDDLRQWNDKVFIGANVVVQPIHIEDRDGLTVLAVTVKGDYASFGITEPLQFNWHFKLAGDRIKSIRIVEVKLDLPAPVVAFIMAMNTFNSAAMFATFADDAMVNDAQREHPGKEAIRRWFDKELIGDRVTMYVSDIKAHQGGYAVTGKVTGNYDKTGLPDPLELRFYFTLGANVITQLIIIPVKRI